MLNWLKTLAHLAFLQLVVCLDARHSTASVSRLQGWSRTSSHFKAAFVPPPVKALEISSSCFSGHPSRRGKTATSMAGDECPKVGTDGMQDTPHPSTLPGDPSLILTTNVDLGDKKMSIMKAISKAIQSNTGKPEAYIAVSITDKADVIFGGSEEPTALGCLYSIGAISMESNGGITKDVTELLEPHGVKADRIYINFFDMPRANVGWSKRTFAG